MFMKSRDKYFVNQWKYFLKSLSYPKSSRTRADLSSRIKEVGMLSWFSILRLVTNLEVSCNKTLVGIQWPTSLGGYLRWKCYPIIFGTSWDRGVSSLFQRLVGCPSCTVSTLIQLTYSLHRIPILSTYSYSYLF